MSESEFNVESQPLVDDHIVCVTLADGSTQSAIRSYNEKTKVFSFADDSGDITATVTSWVAGSCPTSAETELVCLSADAGATIRAGWAVFDADGTLTLKEADGATDVADGAVVVPCSSPEKNIRVECRCDDINSDGSNVVPYVEVFLVEITGATLASTSLGTFTDGTLQTAYVPINGVDCSTIGDAANLQTLVMCDDGTTTFLRTINNVTNATVLDTDATGTLYTAVGTVTVGSCPVQGNSNDYEFVCLSADAGATVRAGFAVFDEDGVQTLVESDGVTVVADGAVPVACSTPQRNLRVECRCDDINSDGSNVVPYVEVYLVETDGTTVTSTLLESYTDGTLQTVYAPTNGVDCSTIGDAANLQTIMMCDDGVTTFLRTINNVTNATVLDTDAAGTLYVPVGTVTVGACPVQGNSNDYEFVCLSADAGETIRGGFVVFDSDGVQTLTEVDGSTVVADGAVPVPCASTPRSMRFACRCDDVAGDGSNIVPYVEVFLDETDGTTVTTTSLGSFTDDTLATTYSPVNPADCSDIGAHAVPQFVQMCDDGTTSFLRAYNVVTGAVLLTVDEAGALYTPAGTVTVGACSVSSSNDYELVCLSTDGGATTRVGWSVFDADGNQTVVEIDGATAITDGAVIVPCVAPASPEVIRICLCDDVAGDGSNIVPFVAAYKQVCNPDDTVTMTLIDNYTDDTLGTAYVPTNATSCHSIGASVDLETVLMCDDGTTTFIRVVNAVNGQTILDIGADGLPYTSVGTPTVGACAVPAVAPAKTTASHVITSGVDTAIPAGLKSVRIKATSGGVTIGTYPLANNEIVIFNATEESPITGILPAISPAGGNWAWLALDEIEV